MDVQQLKDDATAGKLSVDKLVDVIAVQQKQIAAQQKQIAVQQGRIAPGSDLVFGVQVESAASISLVLFRQIADPVDCCSAR